MPLPPVNLAPPFAITRASHVVLTSSDLGASRAFYAGMLGLAVSGRDGNVLYLRGLEEAAHHSLVIRRSRDTPGSSVAAPKRLGRDHAARLPPGPHCSSGPHWSW